MSSEDGNDTALFSGIRINLDEKTIDPNEVSFWIIITSISLFLVWGTFAAFYFSRLNGFFFTFFLDKYLRLSKNGIHLKIGSISISGLHAGKVMFSNVTYDNGDMTTKINDGYVLFRYWRPIENRHLRLDQKRASRLYISLNGVTVKVYNNLKKYAEIARIRRFDWFFETAHMGDAKRTNKPPDTSPPSSVWENVWNLIGVVQIDISSGCVLVGNQYLPYALWSRFENLTSKTWVGESANDRALQTFDSDMENVSVSLIKNETYKFKEGDKEPPRTTGNDGFPLLQTASLSLVYKLDLLGYVTDDDPQSSTRRIPMWTSEFEFGDNTVLSYGPWAELQRNNIYSFFYPNDYQTSPVTVMPQRGQKRINTHFEVKIILKKETCMDVWFERGGQLESIRTRCGANSSIDMSVLWITTEKGFCWDMRSNFLNFEATTSLLFTKLLQCDKFSVDGTFVYPLTWNGEQMWRLDYTFSKATAWFVWDHKRLFTDLINDWMGEEPSDLTKFVPFRVYNKMHVNESFEVTMLLNECNWVDAADKNAENVEIAIVGEQLSFECELPFVDFLPQTQHVKYRLKGEKGIALRAKFPPDSATSTLRAALSRLARISPNAKPSPYGTHSLDKELWWEMCRTELIEMNFDHQYKPIVPREHIRSDIPFAQLIDWLPKPATHPWQLDPDNLGVDILIEGVEIQFTGILIKAILELKNNYFGWYDSMTSIDDVISSLAEEVQNTMNKNEKTKDEATPKVRSAFDRVPAGAVAEMYRPMNVDVTVRLCNIRAEMLLYSPATEIGEEPEKCPVVMVEEVVVEVKKTKNQTLIQVGVGACAGYLDSAHGNSQPGFLTLSGLQFRGQALFSAKDVSWDMGLMEYGWLMEILVGDVGGNLSFPAHIQALHQIAESLLIFALSPDDANILPERMGFCQHGQLTKSCSIAGKKKVPAEARAVCQTEEKLKYRQIRVAVDSVNLTFGDEKTLVQVAVDPVRVTVCNAHEGRFTEHVCVRVPNVKVKQVIRVGEKRENRWLECASAEISGVSLDIELPNDKEHSDDHEKIRREFVKYHDDDTRRLHFLWADHSVWGCACFGNTSFFANVDEVGSTFMQCTKKRKLFVPGIEKDVSLQPKILQSVLDRTKCMLKKERHIFYHKSHTKQPATKLGEGRRGSADTESFHSARSRQTPGRRLMQSAETMNAFSQFVNNLRVDFPEKIEQPSFGEPGSIENWCQRHQAAQFVLDREKEGVNGVRLTTRGTGVGGKVATTNLFSVSGRATNDQSRDATLEVDVDATDTRCTVTGTRQRRLAVSGVAATSLNIFMSPLGIEAIERLVSSATHAITTINPCLLVHMCYRECALRAHRQPLTESLFSAADEDEVPPEIDIVVDLPRVHLALFQCGARQTASHQTGRAHDGTSSTANLAVVLLDRAWIQTKVLALIPSRSATATTAYQLNCNVVAAQLLQLSNRDTPDFGMTQGTTTAAVTALNWDQCPISHRMANYEPRVMLDFNICDVSMLLERRLVYVQSSVRSNTMLTPFHSPVGATPTPQTRLPAGGALSSHAKTASPSVGSSTVVSKQDVPKKRTRLSHENYAKAVIGSITTSIVMARPQEMTAGDEFPIYEALAPVFVSWLSATDNFSIAVTKLTHEIECWRGVAMAKVLKLALDCTDEKVTVRRGKNRMNAVRMRGAHQSSCASCLLLHTLLRWFAHSKLAPEAVARRLDMRLEFEQRDTRKTALMALLSHWQPDIGRHLKLASNEDANKFKVTRLDEATAAAIAKSTRRGRNKTVKKAQVAKDTKIVVDGAEKKAKPSKLGRITPPPLLRKLRKKAGTDGGDEEHGSASLLQHEQQPAINVINGDIELQDMSQKNGTGYGKREMTSFDETEADEDEEDSQETTSREKVDEDKMDLYTWMRNAQREAALNRKLGGADVLGGASEGIETPPKEKEYVNPMDIQQKAFFYAMYRWGRLQWSTLDDIEQDHFYLEYSVLLREVDVRMMAKRVKSSTDQSRQFITPAQQQVMQVRNTAVAGELLWNLERDEKRKVPLAGQWTVSYNGQVEGIRFLIGVATVSLAKELSLVLRAAVDARAELRKRTAADTTPQHPPKRWSMNTQYNHTAEWDDKVLDMTRDYEKHMQRIRENRLDTKDKVKMFVSGTVALSSVVLESVLTDLYVSAMILKIELSHTKNPVPDGAKVPTQHHVTSTSTIDDRKNNTLTRKMTSNLTNSNRIDDISLSLAKASLTLSEADGKNNKSDILRCTLNTTSFSLYTKMKTAGTAVGKNKGPSIDTWAILKLGALEGNMPMAAHSLHDVVMRHGKELEQQLNRLAAQPATPLTSSSSFDASTMSKTSTVVTRSDGNSTTLSSEGTLPQKPTSTIPVPPTPANVPPLQIKNLPEGATKKTLKRAPIAVINFLLEVASVEMNIQLLPSLRAKYRIYPASSNGVTGDQAKWTISIDEHYFEFCVTGQGGKTENFRLQLPSVKCTGHHSVEQDHSRHKPSTDKKLVYREGGSLHTTVLLGHVNHTFTTELLNQLMFAEHSFRAELTALINRIRSSSASGGGTTKQGDTSKGSDVTSTSAGKHAKLDLPRQHVNEKPPLLFTIKVLTKDLNRTKLPSTPISVDDKTTSSPWLQLTAATPTNTAVRLTIDSLEGELTNKWVVKEEGSKERIYGNAVIHFNAKLGQLVKAAQYDEVPPELQEYATFMTQVRVENKERNMVNSSYSYHISLNRPILLVKATAIDKAILLWLNYKNTYDFWRDERDKVVQEKTVATQQQNANAAKTTPTVNAGGMFSPPQIAEDVDMNLSLAINNGMYMCMPLYSHDVTEGMPALVLSLQKSELSVLVKRELTCKASFTGFKLSFVDDFDEQALTQSFLGAAHSEQSNCFFFPEGTYQLCSKASAAGGLPAKWVLSVSAEMQGVEIDLDQRIGKLAKLLVNTFSMIGKDDDDISLWEDQRDLDLDEEKIEGADELKLLKPEDRVSWMENKMHVHSRALFDLASRGVSTRKLEAAKHTLRQYELIRFKAFRRNMVEKWQRRSASNDAPTRRHRTESMLSNTTRDALTHHQQHVGERKASIASVKSKEEELKVGEPETVNFNVDVKVNITSGTCTLRTAKKEGTTQMSFPGQIGETLKRLNQGTRDIKAMFDAPVLTTTTFSIPSVEIKAYHVSDQSETKFGDTFSSQLKRHEKLPKDLAGDAERLKSKLTTATASKAEVSNAKPKNEKTRKAESATTSPLKRRKSKRGCFFMFVGLASMPTETVVTPHLATYLEQVLEPLPPSSVFRSQTLETERDESAVDHKANDIAGGTGVAGTDVHNIVAMDTTQFPIDIVLYLDVQSSTIRFDGKQQTSRNQAQADCLLTLPRLTLEVTTKRTDGENEYVGGMHISGQFKGFMLKIFNPLEPELDSSRALQLSLDLLSFVISRNKNSSSEPDNRVRFVLTSQIGKASFEYNFRRLGELIQFPKPWYRAAIARRVFFGDQAATRQRDDASDLTGTTHRSRHTTHQHSHSNKMQNMTPSVVSTESSNTHATHQSKPWTATVLAAVQWNEFEVTAFMSNTMGKTTWNASKGLLRGDAKLNSALERDISVKFLLGSSELCAREGAISGVIKLSNLRVSGAHFLSADCKKPPRNKAKIKLDWITTNIEWMSRRVLIAKWSEPCFKIRDYHVGVKESEQTCLSSLGLDVCASWQDVQVIMTKTTVDDMSSIVARLISFFQEQLKNSRILLGNFSNPHTLQKKRTGDAPEALKPTTHFWEKVLDYVSEMQLNGQLMPLMEKEGAKAGGKVELKAGKISLVLLKGDMNADTWAVFHLREACISFFPEANMDFLDDKKQIVGMKLKQKFVLQLGSRKDKLTENLANVCRVQTRYNASRQLHKTDDILDYFIGDVMKTLGLHHYRVAHDNARQADRLTSEKSEHRLGQVRSVSSLSRLSATAISPSPSGADLHRSADIKSSHNVLELFQFPGLEATMTSEQLNGLDDGDGYESAFKLPMEVLTTFVCDFYSEVAIETNFNAQVSFLPELLKSYLQEPTSTSSVSSSSAISPSATSSVTDSLEHIALDAKRVDPRVFNCKEWKVEPKVRFIDRIKWTPPVVDDILKKLQIFDHRNTIPKVMQRAVLDPLDACVANGIVAILKLADGKHTIRTFNKSRVDTVLTVTVPDHSHKNSASKENDCEFNVESIRASRLTTPKGGGAADQKAKVDKEAKK